METISVEIFTDQGNNAVIRLPNRRNAGVLVQGDTLKNLMETAQSVRDLAESGSQELREEAEALVDMLTDIYTWYVSATRPE
jgi:hypothetical protein